MEVFLTICRAIFWVAIPAAAAAYAGMYCSEHAGRDLARPPKDDRLLSGGQTLEPRAVRGVFPRS